MDNSEQYLIKQAQLGIEAEAFISSDLGKFLLNKSDDELMSGYEALLTVKPGDSDTLLRLQNQCTRALNFKSWLFEAISTGIYAESELKDG